MDEAQFWFQQQQAGGAQIGNSLRFRGNGGVQRITRTPATSGNRSVWTWSGWVKLAGLDTDRALVSGGTGGNRCFVIIDSSGRIQLHADGNPRVISTPTYTNAAVWYHMVFVLNTPAASEADRFKVWVDNVPITNWVRNASISQNAQYEINWTVQQGIGTNTENFTSRYYHGYMTDVHFIDGQALDPTSFGTPNAKGVWSPKKYTGSYPGNSYYLDFSDPANLGKDRSGNNNDWHTEGFITVTGNPYSSRITVGGPALAGTLQDPQGAFLPNSPTVPDNSQTTGRNAYVDVHGGEGWIQFTPSTPIPGSSVRVFTYQPQGTAGAYTWVNVNGGSNLSPWRVTANYDGWSNPIPITGGALTSLRVTLSYWNASTVRIHAIEVDGVILREGANYELDWVKDSPTNNYCVEDPVLHGNKLFDANLKYVSGAGYIGSVQSIGSMSVSTGKWYWEVVCADGSGTNRFTHMIGWVFTGFNRTSTIYNQSNNVQYFGMTGTIWINGGYGATYGQPIVHGDVIGVASDFDGKTITFYKNNVSMGTKNFPFTGAYFPCVTNGDDSSSVTAYINYGQQPFKYTPPAGYKELCSANM
jgi:hypothetical protein